MKKISCIRNQVKKHISLAAAMVLTLAASGVPQSFSVYAEGEDNEAPVTKIMEPEYTDISMTRWEKVTPSNYKTDSQEHYSILVDMNGNILEGYVEDWVYRGKYSPAIADVPASHVLPEGGGVLYATPDGAKLKDNIEEDYSHFIWCNMYHTMGFGIPVALGDDVFFTDDSKYDITGVYIQWANDTNIHMGQSNPWYYIRMQSKSGRKYWLKPDEHDSEAILTVTEKQGWSRFIFQKSTDLAAATPVLSRFSNKSTWVLCNDDWNNDNEYLVNVHGAWTCADALAATSDVFKFVELYWYQGEKYHFAALAKTNTVNPGMTLPIQNRDVVDSTGKAVHTNGTILQNGCTLTIGKGAVLAIEGNFINNGTIINNGGTILIKKGGSITSFQQGNTESNNGCGKIVNIDGDVIIQEGGALYTGLPTDNGSILSFDLNGSSTLINQGLLVYGLIQMGPDARVELYETSKTYGGINRANGKNPYDFLFKYNDAVVANNGSFHTYTRWNSLIFAAAPHSYGLARNWQKNAEQYPVTVLKADGAVFMDDGLAVNNITVGKLTL